MYIQYNAFIYVHTDRDRAEMQHHLHDTLLNFDDSRTYERYLIPNSVVLSLMGEQKDPLKFTTLLACWMALLSPISPNTSHLASRYELSWEDLQPGSRFLKIVDAIRRLRLHLETSIYDMRFKANEYHDRIAGLLHWPSFDEMRDAMSNVVHERNQQVLAQDPFYDVSMCINERRSEVPWCDIFPGEEMRKGDNPLRIPLIVEPGGIVACPGSTGEHALRVFALTRLVDFVVFGQSDVLLDKLFSLPDEDLNGLVDAVLPGIDFEWLRLQHRQRRVTGNG